MAISTANVFIAVVSMIAAIIYSGQSSLFIQKLNEIFHWKAGCNPSFSVGNVTLHYFSGRGRAEAIRLLLEDQHVPYTETRYTKENWPEAKKAGIEAGVYTYGQVPAIVTSKNKNLVQSKVILQFLGRSVGLDCDCKDLERCDIIAAGVDDIHQKRNRYIYNPDFSHALKDEYEKNVLIVWLNYFEQLAPRVSDASDGVHFASDRMTWVDYLVFDMIDSNCHFVNYGSSDINGETPCVVLLKKFPRLTTFFNHFKTRENIQIYMNSERRPEYKLPYRPK